MKFIRRILFIGASLMVLVLLFLALIIFAPTMTQPIVRPVRAWLVRMVSTQASNAINGSLSIGSLEGSLVSAPIIRDVVLQDAQGDVVMQLEALRLRYDLTQLLQKKLLVHDITLVRPRASIIQAADGSNNLSRLALPSDSAPEPEDTTGAGLPIDIEVVMLAIENGQVELQLPSLSGVKTVKNINLQVGAILSKHENRVELKQLTAQTLPANVDLKALSGAFRQVGSEIQIDDLKLDTDASHIKINGTLPGSGQPADLTVSVAPFDMADIGRLLADPAFTGHLQAQLTAEGPPKALNIAGRISAKEGEVTVDGRLNMADPTPRYQATLDITQLNIAALVQRDELVSDLNLHLALEGSGLAPADLQSEARVQILPSRFGDITLNPSDIHVIAKGQRIDLQQFHLDTSVAQINMSGLLDFNGDSDLHYDLQVQLPDLRQLLGTEALDGAAHLQGHASGAWPNLTTTGTFKAQGLRYDTTQLRDASISYRASQLGAEPIAEVQVRLQDAQLSTLPVAQLDLQATYDQAASQLQFTTEVAQSADYDGTLGGKVTFANTGADAGQEILLDTLRIRLQDRTWHAPQPLDVALVGKRVDINHIQIVHDDESITASGRLEGTNFDDLRLQAKDVDLDFLRSILALPALVSGRASLEASLSGSMEAPILKANLQVDAPSRPSLPFEDIRATVAYARQQLNGQIRVRQQTREVIDFNLNLPVNLVLNDISPAKLLVDAPTALNLKINQPDLQALHRALPTLPPLAGTLQVDVDLQGTYAQLELDSTIDLQQFGLPGTIENINAPFTLTGTVLTAESVSALTQSLADGALSPTIRDLTLRAASIKGQLPSPEQPAQTLHVSNLLLRADAHLPSDRGPDVTLHTLSLQAQALNLPPTQLDLAAAMTAERLDIKRLDIQSANSKVNGQGVVGLIDGQQIQFTLAIPRLRLSDFAPTLPPNLPKELQGTIRLTGSPQAPQVVTRLRYAGARIEANLDAELDKALPTYNAKLLINALDISKLMPDITGRLNARLRLSGAGFEGAKRRASVALDIDSPNFALAPGLITELRAVLQGDAVQLNTLSIQSDPITLDAGGTLSNDQRAALTYNLDLGDLTALRKHLGLDFDVKGQLRGKVSGALDALRTEGTLTLAPWRYDTWQGKAINATFSAHNLTTQPQAEVKAKLVNVKGPSLDTSSLAIDGTYHPERGNFDIRVTDGPFQRTQITGEALLQTGQDLTLSTLNLQRGDWVWSNSKPIHIVRDAAGKLQVSDFELRNGKQAILARATLPPQGPISGKVRIDQLHIPSNVKAFAPDAAIPDGYVQLDMDLKGTMQAIGAEGILQLTGLAWQKKKLGTIEAQLDLAENTLNNTVSWRDDQAELLRLEGSIGLDAAGAVDMRIQSRDFDLARLPSFTEAVQKSAGDLNIDLRVNGTTKQPEVNGRLDIANGLLQLPVTGEPFKDIGAQIIFAGNRIALENFNVGSSTGDLNLNGEIELAGTALKTLDFTMAADNFTAIKTADIEAILDSNLTAKGSMEDLAVKGNITIPRAKIRIEGLLGGGPAAVSDDQLTVQGVYGTGKTSDGAKGDAKPVSQQADPLPFLQADVKIDMPKNVWFQAQGATIEISSDLKVTKELQKPLILSGDIETLRGFASYLGKKFTIKEGRVTFTGTEEINPVLDITATHKVSSYIVSIRVQGDSKLPKIALSSEPEALEQADIISLLAFGRTTDKLTGSEQGSLANKAQNAAVGAAAGAAASAVGEQIGLDSVEIEVGDDPSQTKIGTGKYITQDLFLSYERQLGSEGGNTVGVELSLDPLVKLKGLKLKGSSSTVGETAVDLLWRRDY